jgi:hypothetical protein
MRPVLVCLTLLLCGCAATPVQERTLVDASGGTVTCNEISRGVASFWAGRSVYDYCVARALAQGYK